MTALLTALATGLGVAGLTVLPSAALADTAGTSCPAVDPVQANSLLRNGDFEDGPDFGFTSRDNYGIYTTVSPVPGGEKGPTDLAGWTVTRGDVEVDNSPPTSPGTWVPASGCHSFNLDGNVPGAVEQTVSGLAAGDYQLRFAVQVHPGASSASATMVVTWDGASLPLEPVSRKSTRTADGHVVPDWQDVTYVVHSDGSGSDTLAFDSGTPDTCGQPASNACSTGIILDDVSLVALDERLTDVSLTAAPASTPPGASRVPLADLPLDQLPDSALTAVAAAPLRSVPLRSVPLRSVPLRSIPLRSVPLRSVPLRSVTLNQLPLVGGTSWADVLAGTPYAGVPEQNVTLGQVLDADPPGLAAVSLDDVDVSASPLRSISLASLYLGAVPMSDLTLPGGGSLYDAVCAADPAACTDGITADSPLLAADLAGAPLRSIPLRSVPLRSIATTDAPLRSVPLRSIPLRSVPLRSVPLRSIDGVDVAGNEALSGIRLGDLSPSAALLTTLTCGEVVTALPDLSLSCAQGAALSQAVGADPAFAAVTLGRLATCAGEGCTALLDSFTLGDLGPFDETAQPDVQALTIGDIAASAASSVSLAAAIASLVDPAQVPWESLPLDALDLPAHDASGPLVYYTASYTLAGSGPARDVDVAVTLPAGFTVAGDVSGLPPGASEAQPADGGRTVTWHLPDVTPSLDSAPTRIRFAVHPSLALVTAAPASLTVTVASLSLPTGAGEGSTVTLPALSGAAAEAAPVTVVATPSPDPASAPLVQPDTLLVGHTAAPGTPTYVRVPVPPAGTRVSFFLSHLTADDDLVVYGAPVQDSAPSAAPLRSIPLRSVPLPDPGADALTAPAAVPGDVPLLPGRPLLGASTQRGTADEEVATLSAGPQGAQSSYLVQVTGYQGAVSDQPWVLRVQEITPPETTCPSRGYPAQRGAGTSSPSVVDPTARSLFLVDGRQLTAEYGDVSALMRHLTAFAGRKDVGGAVVDVSRVDAVAAAYDAWNAEPCSVDLANATVRSITQLVLDYQRQDPALRSVTLVGADEQLPMARVPDLTSAVNERGFATGDLTASGADNPFSAAQKAGYLLSDDPYGTLQAVPWLDRRLYVPQLAVGRLVETPAQIEGQLREYELAGGVVDPASALTTGYDFLADGARAVDAALTAAVKKGPHQALIGEDWTGTQLLGALFPATGPSPSLISVNAHFDQSRLLPAAGNAAGTETGLVTTGDVDAKKSSTVGGSALAGRLLFSMGCHAGLSTPALYSGDSADTATWARELAAQQALWVANTGYGLGDTASVALSEALMRDFAQNLDGSYTAGGALAYAKQTYLGSLGAYGAADEKALQEVVLYGLPMWRIGGKRSDGTRPVVPTAPALPTVATTGAGDATGLPVADAVTASSFTQRPGSTGTFWDVQGQTQTTAGLPIQPRTSLPASPADPSVGDAHGVLVTSLASHDVEGVTPQLARAVLDQSSNEPSAVVAGASSFAGLATLSSYDTPAGTATDVVLVPGQFIAPAGEVKGTQRLFDSVGTRVYYSKGTSFTPPTLSGLESHYGFDGHLGSVVTFSVTASSADPGADAVRRVLVLVHDGDAWRPLDLRPTGSVWSGTLPVRSSSVQWFAQAVTSQGNVGVSSAKGALFSASTDFSVAASGPKGSSGYFLGPVTVTVGPVGGSYTASDNGAPVVVGDGSFIVAAEGPHTVVVGNGTTTRSVSFTIDSHAPTVSITDPPGGVFRLDGPGEAGVVCDDGGDGSGVVDCPGTLQLDTSRPGTITVRLPQPVRDQAGNETSEVTYQVDYGFEFAWPTQDGGVNRARAGGLVPVVFRITAADGPVSDRQAVVSVDSAPAACSDLGVGLHRRDSRGRWSEPRFPAHRSSPLLVLPGGYYSYLWLTPRSWKGTCRTLTVTLADGTQHTIAFAFR